MLAVVAESVAVAPEAGTVNVTVPETGAPVLSISCTSSPAPNAVPAAADWPSPATTVSVLAPRLVSAKLAGVAMPGAAAVTAYTPTVLPLVAVMLARPLASVTAVVAESVALAPLAGAVKVTVTPLTGLPSASATATTSGRAKAVAGLAGAVCGVPLTA